MKKYLSMMLILCLILSAAGCGKSQAAAAETAETAVTEAAHAEPTEGETQAANPAVPTFRKTATLEETVLYDENNIRITATALSYSHYSADVELLLENNSQKPQTFICESMGYSCNSVNDYMIEDGYLNCTVDPGKKANDTVSIGLEELMLHGIYEIREMEIGFDISDDDHNDLYTGPLLLQTSAAGDRTDSHYLSVLTDPGFMEEMEITVPYTAQEVLYEENGIRLLSSCFVQKEDGKQILMVEAENGTEEMLHLSVRDVSLNGLHVDPSTHSHLTVNPGKRGLLSIVPASAMEPEFWENYGIQQLTSIGFCLEINDMEWNSQALSDQITVNLGMEQTGFDASGEAVYSQDGLQIFSRGIVEDPSDYSQNQHVLLLAVNASDHTVTIDDVYNSVSVNGFMTDYYFHGQELSAGESGVIQLELTESSLEKNKIENISEVELRVTVDDGEEVTLNLAY